MDRFIYGDVKPVDRSLTLDEGKELATHYFLERREIGIINIGGAGRLTLDGEIYEINNREGIYIGRGTKGSFIRICG